MSAETLRHSTVNPEIAWQQYTLQEHISLQLSTEEQMLQSGRSYTTSAPARYTQAVILLLLAAL
jgi:hypothetical protein